MITATAVVLWNITSLKLSVETLVIARCVWEGKKFTDILMSTDQMSESLLPMSTTSNLLYPMHYFIQPVGNWLEPPQRSTVHWYQNLNVLLRPVCADYHAQHWLLGINIFNTPSRVVFVLTIYKLLKPSVEKRKSIHLIGNSEIAFTVMKCFHSNII